MYIRYMCERCHVLKEMSLDFRLLLSVLFPVRSVSFGRGNSGSVRLGSDSMDSGTGSVGTGSVGSVGTGSVGTGSVGFFEYGT